jgi:hypothetical protein
MFTSRRCNLTPPLSRGQEWNQGYRVGKSNDFNISIVVYRIDCIHCKLINDQIDLSNRMNQLINIDCTGSSIIKFISDCRLESGLISDLPSYIRP